MATPRTTYLELAKIAKQRGTLNKTLLNVYLTNMIRTYRKEQAAAATATRDERFKNYY
ncbi:hypothetical protein [Paenibacillus dakarensis]|uniref:hypothetical protein n=1 Tax=Paenibacillus dakarensis TaxID=1527293 RepID=UPI0012E299F8|nr:hypothetical protein [Paenibacillus dakarensis]